MSFIQQPHSLSPFQMFVFSAPPHTKPSQHPHLPPLGLVQDSPSPPRTPLCPDLWVSPHYSHCFCCFKPYFSVIRAIHVHYRKITGSRQVTRRKKTLIISPTQRQLLWIPRGRFFQSCMRVFLCRYLKKRAQFRPTVLWELRVPVAAEGRNSLRGEGQGPGSLSHRERDSV